MVPHIFGKTTKTIDIIEIRCVASSLLEENIFPGSQFCWIGNASWWLTGLER
jgi:hypothetical protein